MFILFPAFPVKLMKWEKIILDLIILQRATIRKLNYFLFFIFIGLEIHFGVSMFGFEA